MIRRMLFEAVLFAVTAAAMLIVVLAN